MKTTQKITLVFLLICPMIGMAETKVIPIKKENLKTLNVLRTMAEHQPKVREILKNAGLM